MEALSSNEGSTWRTCRWWVGQNIFSYTQWLVRIYGELPVGGNGNRGHARDRLTTSLRRVLEAAC